MPTALNPRCYDRFSNSVFTDLLTILGLLQFPINELANELGEFQFPGVTHSLKLFVDALSNIHGDSDHRLLFRGAWAILLAWVPRKVAGRGRCSSPCFGSLLSEDELVGVRTCLLLSFPPPLNLLIRHEQTP